MSRHHAPTAALRWSRVHLAPRFPGLFADDEGLALERLQAKWTAGAPEENASNKNPELRFCFDQTEVLAAHDVMPRLHAGTITLPIGQSAMPWHAAEEDGKIYKYQYHPHGDTSQPLRNAPSAMNTVIVPKVTLPEV